MNDAVALIAAYQNWVYVLIVLAGVYYLWGLRQARHRLSQTPFGLEREAALQRQNRALGMLSVLVALGVLVYLTDRVIIPQVQASQRGPETPAPGASPTPSGAAGVDPLVVDSSGCENPNATFTSPAPEAQITGAFEVIGTANVDNFAFYKLELNGAGTSGQWVPVEVSTEPQVDGLLGSVDSSSYAPGRYAFRLVVMDSSGNSPPPCVVAITLSNVVGPFFE